VAQGCLLALTLLLTIVQLPVALPGRIASLKAAEQQMVFEYLQDHRESTYFPWFPLSHLLAEGRFYHSSYGIIDRVLAGDEVSPRYFQAYAPANMSSIAFGKDGSREMFGIDLLSFWAASHACPVDDPVLPSWHVYRNSGSSCGVFAAATQRVAAH
jgi:hypothetical protein